MMTNDFFEFINLYLLLVDGVVLFILTLYLLRSSNVSWLDYGTQVALSLGLYIGGHATIRGWTWFWRFSQSHGWWTSTTFTETIPVIPFGLAMSTIGLIWLSMRLYSSISLGVWLVLVTVAAMVAASVAWFI